MKPTLLTSRRLSSTPRTSQQLSVDTRNHRPGSSGSVVPGEASTAVSPSTPSSGSTVPSFPVEGVRDGWEAAEHTIDNSEPDTSEPGTPTPSQEQPAQDNHGQGRSRGRWLGALGALVGLFVFLALLGGHHHHGSSPQPGLSGVGMPTTLPGKVPVEPLRIAVVLGDGLTPQAQTREIHTLESWLSGHVNPATRLTIVDAAQHTTTPALRPSGWDSAVPSDRFQGATADALRRRLGIGRGHRVIVTFDHPDPLSAEDLARLHLVARPSADLPKTVALRSGHTVTAAVDPTEIHALANTTARAVISISNMTEGSEE